MARIAAIFHWPPDQLEALPLERLVMWANLATEEWNHLNRTKD